MKKIMMKFFVFGKQIMMKLEKPGQECLFWTMFAGTMLNLRIGQHRLEGQRVSKVQTTRKMQLNASSIGAPLSFITSKISVLVLGKN